MHGRDDGTIHPDPRDPSTHPSGVFQLDACPEPGPHEVIAPRFALLCEPMSLVRASASGAAMLCDPTSLHSRAR